MPDDSGAPDPGPVPARSGPTRWRVPAPGWRGLLGIPGPGVELVGEDLHLPDRTVGRAHVSSVELRPTGDPARPGFAVRLVVRGERVPVVEGVDRLVARGVAERLARGLELRLQDFSGRELVLRQPGDLDAALGLDPPPPPPGPAPEGVSGGAEEEGVRIRRWNPALGLVAVGILGSLFGMALNLGWLTSAAGGLLALGACTREVLRASAAGVRWSRGPFGWGLTAFLPRDEIEQLGFDATGGEGHLLIVSDRRLIDWVGPPDATRWVRAALLWGLAGAPALPGSNSRPAEPGDPGQGGAGAPDAEE